MIPDSARCYADLSVWSEYGFNVSLQPGRFETVGRGPLWLNLDRDYCLVIATGPFLDTEKTLSRVLDKTVSFLGVSPDGLGAFFYVYRYHYSGLFSSPFRYCRVFTTGWFQVPFLSEPVWLLKPNQVRPAALPEPFLKACVDPENLGNGHLWLDRSRDKRPTIVPGRVVTKDRPAISRSIGRKRSIIKQPVYRKAFALRKVELGGIKKTEQTA